LLARALGDSVSGGCRDSEVGGEVNRRSVSCSAHRRGVQLAALTPTLRAHGAVSRNSRHPCTISSGPTPCEDRLTWDSSVRGWLQRLNHNVSGSAVHTITKTTEMFHRRGVVNPASANSMAKIAITRADAVIPSTTAEQPLSANDQCDCTAGIAGTASSQTQQCGADFFSLCGDADTLDWRDHRQRSG
jgi:hypothetical protein